MKKGKSTKEKLEPNYKHFWRVELFHKDVKHRSGKMTLILNESWHQKILLHSGRVNDMRAAQCAQFQCGGVTVDIRRHDFDSNNGICLLWQAHSADHNVSQKSLQTELYEHFLTKIDLHFVFGNIEHDAGMCTVYMCSEQCRDVVRFH